MRKLVFFAALLFAAAFSHRATAQVESLVLYLPFDEGKGGVAADLSGLNNHAELRGGAKWVEGRYGGGVLLDTQAHVEVPHHDSLSLQAMTLMCWIRIDADTGDQASSIEKGPAWGIGEYNLLGDYNNQVLLQIHDLPDGCDDELTGGTVMDGAWHHIAGMFDGAQIRIYVDGVEVRKGECEGELQANTGVLYIGARGGSSRWTKGAYDEVRIYNVGLDDDDIVAAMLDSGASLAVQPDGKTTVAWGTLKARSADTSSR